MPEIPFAARWTIPESRLIPLKDSIKYCNSQIESFTLSEHFYLSLYPNGSEDKRRGKTCMFLYISFKNPRKVVAKWNVTIESANFSFSCQKMYDQNQGWGKFICDTKDFFDPEKKFIVDGKCTVEVTGTFKFATENPSITDIGQKWEGGEFGDELWAKQETKDLRIIVNGKNIRVDKSVLDVRSNAFYLMLQTNMKESIKNKVTITDFTFEVVETAVKMIYNCTFTSSLFFNEQMSLLKFFDKYDLPNLKEKIEQLLIKQISVSTVCRLTNCSILTNSSNLKAECMKFLMHTFFETNNAVADLETLEKDIALKILQNSEEVTGTFQCETANPSSPDIEQKWGGGELGDELWANEETKDFTIIVDEEEIKVHKLILGTRSKYFSSMLSTKMKESIENKVTITDFTFEVVQTAVKMIYDCNFTSTLSFNDQLVLLQFYDKYDLPNFKEKIEQLLIKQISASTVCRLTNWSIPTNSSILKAECMKFFKNAFFYMKHPVADLETLEKDIALKILRNSRLLSI